MQRKWKRRWQRLTKLLLPPVASGVLLLSAYSAVYANPAGGTVTSGAAAIAANSNTMTVTQTTDKATINWQSFNIAAGEKVQFIQPGTSSVALNRVVGNDASSIYGTLSANGKVFLINPNGVLFAPGAQVNVGGLAVSTLALSDKDFVTGNYTFSGNGTGSVINQGTITAANEAVFIGPQVKNEGVIAAKVTGLAAGNKISLDFSGDHLLNVTVDTGAAGGSAANSGAINASGGTVIMTAGTRDALLSTVVNNSGIIRAQSVKNVSGVIRLEGGSVTNSGTLDASGKAAGQTGGTVKVLGDSVTLAQGSNIDVSGDTGGGTVLIGGNFHGQGAEYTATTAKVDQGAAITADALTKGNGGKVAIWSNGTTTFAGTISAKSGAVSGDGGNVETSGHTLTVASTAKVNTLADHGTTGSWLLDPYNFTIDDTGTAGMKAADLSADLQASDITIQTTGSGVSVTGVPSPNSTSGDGDIIVASPLSWTSASTLTLNAYHSVLVNAGINGTNLVVNYNYTNTNANPSGNFLVASGARVTLAGNNPSLSINGDSYTLISSVNQLDNWGGNGKYALNADLDAGGTTYHSALVDTVSGVFDGLGHTISYLTIDSSNQLIGLFGINNGTIRNLGLVGGSVTMSGTTNQTTYIGGLAAQNNHTIVNCYNTGNVTLSGAVNYHQSYIGGLAGANYAGGSIANCYSTGAISSCSYSYTGGLAGYNAGANAAITNCYSTGPVSNTSSNGNNDNGSVGGLVGVNENTASIMNCYSTGAVNNNGSNSYVGGLTGFNQMASIKNCYSTGAVSNAGSYSNVGGLVGFTDAFGGGTTSIDSCYSTGAVTSTDSSSQVGGLAGYNYSDTSSHAGITNCYWDASTSGQNTGIGLNTGNTDNDAAGLSTADFMNAEKFTKWSSAIVDTSSHPSSYSSYTWVIVNGSTRPMLVSEYSTTITNAHQLQLMALDLGASYTLGNNIDARATNSGTDIWGSGGFVPVGANGYSLFLFAGTLNGAGHTIDRLTIHRPDASGYYAGLFTGISGTVNKVGLTNANITGDWYDGALAGINSGSGQIIECFSTGSVNGNGVSDQILGGLVGLNNGSIRNCYSTAVVTDTITSEILPQVEAGGLVGQNTNGAIHDCYSSSTVNISGYGHIHAGGLVGGNYGTSSIIDSYYLDTAGTGLSGIGLNFSGDQVFILTTDSDIKNSSFYSSWSLDTDGTNSSAAWRIYDGKSAPLLKAFLTPLTVSAGSASKTYDGSAYSGALTSVTYATATGFSSNPPALVNGRLSYGNNPNAGAYSLTGLYCADQQGYDIRYDPASTLTINKRPIIINPTPNQSKIYGNADPTLAYSAGEPTGDTGIVGSDSVSYTGALARNSGENAADYPITLGTLASGNSNYILSLSITPVDFTVKQRPIIINPTPNQSKIYGNADPTLAYTAGEPTGDTGIVGSDSVSYTGVLARNPGENAADYPITLGTLSSGNSNYVLSLSTTPVDFTVKQRPISYSIGNTTAVYGTAATLGAVSLIGIINNDTVNATVSVYDTANTPVSLSPTTRAGTYSERVTALSNANYTLAATGNTPGTITINTAPWQSDAYTGAVGTVDQRAFSPSFINAGPLFRTAGVQLPDPLTVIPPGINLTGDLPLTAAEPSGQLSKSDKQ